MHIYRFIQHFEFIVVVNSINYGSLCFIEVSYTPQPTKTSPKKNP